MTACWEEPPLPDDDEPEPPETALIGYGRSPARRDTLAGRTIHDVLETL
ncbi:hypothetical protein [Streptomyces sp. DH12]|nr:hypothetical protein [Streptomyces sp. DH12]